MDKKIEEIIKSINDLKASNSKIITSVNKYGEKVTQLSNKFDHLAETISMLKEENNMLKEKIINLDERILQLENNISTNNFTTDEKVFQETIDRQARSCNIILFNLSESDENNDEIRIKDLLTVMKSNIENFSFNRLGKPTSLQADKPRPIKIKLRDQSDVFYLLRSQKQLQSSSTWKEIRLSSDRTMMQREHMSNLRKELQQRREKGENNIIIKYIKGIPKIINLSKN